jgi:hypothetical protein
VKLLQPTVMMRAPVFPGTGCAADWTGLGTKAGPAEAGIPEKAVAIDRAMMANLFILLTLGQRMYRGGNAAEGNRFHFGME